MVNIRVQLQLQWIYIEKKHAPTQQHHDSNGLLSLDEYRDGVETNASQIVEQRQRERNEKKNHDLTHIHNILMDHNSREKNDLEWTL